MHPARFECAEPSRCQRPSGRAPDETAVRAMESSEGGPKLRLNACPGAQLRNQGIGAGAAGTAFASAGR